MQLTPTEALGLWHRVMVGALKAETPDLSTRQFTLLLQIYLAPPPHTVRGLARQLSISKPAVTRALDRLADHRLIRRKTDERDRRSVLVQRTVQGAVFLREFGDLATNCAAGLSGPCGAAHSTRKS